MADTEALATRLDELAEELADAAMAALREAVESGARHSTLERRLTRARRSVERAAQLLRDQPPDPGD